MASSDLIEMEGEVVDAFRGGKFKVVVWVGEEQKEVTCTPAGKLRQFKINIVTGDRVLIQVSPYDTSLGRIVRRLK